MEQILAFVLGVGAVAFVWVVVMAFKTVKKIKQIEYSNTGLREWVQRNDDLVNRRIDQEVDRMNQNDEMINRRIDQEVDRVNQIATDCIRHTDSRVDKLEAKVFASPKEILKG